VYAECLERLGAVHQLRLKINGGATVFQQGLALAEVDEAVARLATPFRQPKSAAGGVLQLVALRSPRGQASGPFFAAGRARAWAE
jgi:hypothetical protein